MFPGIQADVRRRLRAAAPALVTALGRPYLPIGSALLTPAPGGGSCLVSAPTMTLPQDVSGTRNAYHAFMACLCLVHKARADPRQPSIDVLVVPGLCTGWGNMSPHMSASQVHAAYRDFVAGVRPDDQPDLAAAIFIAPEPVAEQPNYFANREFKTIDVRDVVREPPRAASAH
jgi:hypothetical protein